MRVFSVEGPFRLNLLYFKRVLVTPYTSYFNCFFFSVVAVFGCVSTIIDMCFDTYQMIKNPLFMIYFKTWRVFQFTLFQLSLKESQNKVNQKVHSFRFTPFPTGKGVNLNFGFVNESKRGPFLYFTLLNFSEVAIQMMPCIICIAKFPSYPLYSYTSNVLHYLYKNKVK